MCAVVLACDVSRHLAVCGSKTWWAEVDCGPMVRLRIGKEARSTTPKAARSHSPARSPQTSARAAMKMETNSLRAKIKETQDRLSAQALKPRRPRANSELRRETAAINEYVRKRGPSLGNVAQTAITAETIESNTASLHDSDADDDCEPKGLTTNPPMRGKPARERLAEMQDACDAEKAALGIVPLGPEPTLAVIATAKAAAKVGGGVFYTHRDNNELHMKLKRLERENEGLASAKKVRQGRYHEDKGAYTHHRHRSTSLRAQVLEAQVATLQQTARHLSDLLNDIKPHYKELADARKDMRLSRTRGIAAATVAAAANAATTVVAALTSKGHAVASQGVPVLALTDVTMEVRPSDELTHTLSTAQSFSFLDGRSFSDGLGEPISIAQDHKASTTVLRRSFERAVSAMLSVSPAGRRMTHSTSIAA